MEGAFEAASHSNAGRFHSSFEAGKGQGWQRALPGRSMRGALNKPRPGLGRGALQNPGALNFQTTIKN